MKKAKLVILRHGQTDYNVKHLMTGQLDIPLNKVGEAQGKQAGILVKHIRFDKAYSSTLSRSFNTAVIVVKNAGSQPHLKNKDGTFRIEQRKELMEIDNGDFTGHSRITDPIVANKQMIYDERWPNGESMKDVVERVQKIFDAEIKPYLLRGENVLIVAHSVVVEAFEIVIGASEIPGPIKLEDKKKRLNAAPMVCDYEDGVMKNVSYLENKKTTQAANQNVSAQKKHRPKP